MLDGVKTTCLIDNGARVNLVTPEFVKHRGLEVGSIQDLNNHDGYIPLSGLGGKITEPLGYVILQVQIPYVPSYNEDQVVLVVPEDSNFLKRCQVVKQHKNFRNLANQDWVRAQSRDPVIPQVIKWINQPKEDCRKLEEYLARVTSDYEKWFYVARQKEFVLQDNLLYLQVTPTKSQDTGPVFVIPTAD